MTDSVVPQPQLATLADAREHAIRVLTDRYADDTLTSAEFEGRLDRLYGTQTAAAAHGLVADLLVPRELAPVPPRPAPLYAPPAAQAVLDVDEVLCVFAERAYVARRHQSARLSVRALFGTVTLDLRDLPAGAVREIEVQALFAEVRVLLPADAEIEVDVDPVLGTVTDDTSLSWSQLGGARVRVHGTAAFAEVAMRRAPGDMPGSTRFQDMWKEAGRVVRQARKALRTRGGR